jgi:hypothetical protein
VDTNEAFLLAGYYAGTCFHDNFHHDARQRRMSMQLTHLHPANLSERTSAAVGKSQRDLQERSFLKEAQPASLNR